MNEAATVSVSGPSIVIVMSDTLRRDRVGLHGGRARTPNYDGFASEYAWYRNATANAPWTKPSIATLFTGLLPSQHGVVSHPELRQGRRAASAEALRSDVLPEELGTLAEQFQRAGYRTAGIVTNPWLQSELGFSQGFDHWDDSLRGNDVAGQDVTERVLDWLAKTPDDGRPFLLYLHYMDAHRPFPVLTDEEFEARRAEVQADTRIIPSKERRVVETSGLRALENRRTRITPALFDLLYDTGVERFDVVLGELLASLARDPRGEELAIVVTSDHGHALYERGREGHGYALFEEDIGIPLAARLPDAPERGRQDCITSLAEVGPALCRYAGISCGLGDGTGNTPAPAADAGLFCGSPAGAVVSEGVINRPGYRAARDARYKLVVAPGQRERLFDLEADPAEKQNRVADLLADAELEEAAQRLRAALAAPHERVTAPESRTLDGETRSRLEALGYLGPDPPMSEDEEATE